MAYQALLFCPDEKTARTVTQVLSELDFSVVPCTEPFAAVKKLMGEHFDAVVVDCDNEQNATLLFKSARNAPNNHSSLAVAVVEGQAGVAKAFRIGANLVLTKPVNVEQAKGTLRVARGLLRKSELAKPAPGAAPAAVKPAAPVAGPPKLLSRPFPTVAPAGQAAPIAASAAAASIPTPKTAPRPTVVASVPTDINEADVDLFEAPHEEIASPSNLVPAPAPAPVPEAKIAASKAGSQSPVAGQWPTAGGFAAGAASAPAPAREQKSSVARGEKPSTVISEPESAVEKVAVGADGSVEGTVALAPAFTLGGNVESETAPAGGKKKMLLVVAAVALIVVGGYEVWMQWIRSSGAATPFTRVATQPVKTSAAAPQTPPITAPSTTSPVASSSVPSSSVPTSSVRSSAAGARQPAPKASASSDNAQPRSAPENDAPAPSRSERAIVVKNHASPSRLQKSVSSVDDTAPTLAGITANGSLAMPNLLGGGKAPAPVLQDLHISQGVSRGLLVKEVPPAYPASAQQRHAEGDVELLATITRNGDISTVKVLSGDPQLAHAAVEAVKRWKYKPYLLNGEPVEIQTPVTVKFKLPR
jgi:periplasmic protein TonB